MPPVRPYDLALEEGDFAPWEGPPLRSIIICSHPRSGSSLLGEALRFAGGLGCPLEYLHRGFRPALAERWSAQDLTSYMAALQRSRTDANGVFSIKLFWQDLEEVAHETAPDSFPPPRMMDPGEADDAAYHRLLALVARLCPNPEFVYLERRDRIRQAISAVVATQTGLWRSIPGVGRQDPVGSATFDYDRILGMIAFADYSREHWHAFYKANAISPYRLTYEDLIGDYEGTVTALLARLGSATTRPPQPRMQRQGDAASEAMVLRFLQEHAARRI